MGWTPPTASLCQGRGVVNRYEGASTPSLTLSRRGSPNVLEHSEPEAQPTDWLSDQRAASSKAWGRDIEARSPVALRDSAIAGGLRSLAYRPISQRLGLFDRWLGPLPETPADRAIREEAERLR